MSHHKNPLLIIHGPNLNLLGTREPDIYGSQTLAELNKKIREYAEKTHGFSTLFFQSNHEGCIIDFIHEHYEHAAGIIINPAALTHYSYALRDAIAATGLPAVEVHLSDIHSREPFRKISVIEPVCIGQVSGKGVGSYVEGVDRIVKV